MVDGVVMVVDNYAKILCQDERFDVTVFAPRARKKDFVDDRPYKVVRCKAWKAFFKDQYMMGMPGFDKKFKRAVKEADLDIIHVHSPFGVGTMGTKFAKKHNIPCIMTFHSQFKRDFKKSIFFPPVRWMMMRRIMKVFNRANVVWTMNPACEALVKEYGYRGLVELVPNGTDLLPPKDVAAARKQIREEYNIPADTFTMMNIGRVSTIKNLDFVIDVVAEIKNRGTDLRLLLVGSGPDENYFKSKVEKLGLNDQVIFTGKVMCAEKKSAMFAASDLKIFPSFYDTDGIVRIEAAACHCPTIFIKDSIASSTITPDVNGYIGEDSVPKFAEKIIDIIGNPKLNETVRKNAFKDIYITWAQVLDIAREKYLTKLKK